MWAEQAQEEQQRQAQQGDTWFWTDQYTQTQRQQQQQQQRRTAGRGGSSSGSSGSTQQQQQQQAWARAASNDLDKMSPYQVLGVTPGVSTAELTVAFRREMLKWHPDRQGSKSPQEQAYALARSQAITQAYRLLKGK
jgi:DnaJ-domain-containing protein 1